MSNWTSNVPNTGLGSKYLKYDGFRKLKLAENLSAKSTKRSERVKNLIGGKYLVGIV